MKPLIEIIRLIPPPKANEYKDLYLKKKNDDFKAVNRIIEMYLRTALRLSIPKVKQLKQKINDLRQKRSQKNDEYIADKQKFDDLAKARQEIEA